jgi:hypothetical protein
MSGRHDLDNWLRARFSQDWRRPLKRRDRNLRRPPALAVVNASAADIGSRSPRAPPSRSRSRPKVAIRRSALGDAKLARLGQHDAPSLIRPQWGEKMKGQRMVTSVYMSLTLRPSCRRPHESSAKSGPAKPHTFDLSWPRAGLATAAVRDGVAAALPASALFPSPRQTKTR